MTTLIDRVMLDGLAEAATQVPRRRRHHSFHPNDAYPAHRLLVAIEPDSYVAPHCHLNPDKDETLVVVRGRLGVVCFSSDGTVDRCFSLEAGGEAIGVDIPHGVFHTVLALMPGTVFFEAKAGPYVPIAEAERAAWAPPEGSSGAAACLSRLISLFAQENAE